MMNVSHIDEGSPTISYIQDVTVDYKGKRIDTRVLWDTGSNRILVNNDFAKENNMSSTPALVKMKKVGGVEQKLDVKIYEMGLVERSGRIQFGAMELILLSTLKTQLIPQVLDICFLTSQKKFSRSWKIDALMF